MEEIQNCTIATLCYDVCASIITMFLCLEHPWVVKVHLLLVFAMLFWFGLSNFRISPRNLPQGLIVTSGRACGIAWANP